MGDGLFLLDTALAIEKAPPVPAAAWQGFRFPPEVITVMASAQKRNNRHVVPAGGGGWNVKRPGAARVSAHTDTQAQAINRARDIIHNAGGGELLVHGRDGQIRAKDTISPGNNPYPPKG